MADTPILVDENTVLTRVYRLGALRPQKMNSPWGYLGRGAIARKIGISRHSFLERLKNWPQERWFEPPKVKP